jgi:hypothetical protein
MSKRRYLVVGGIVVAAVLLSTLLYTVLGNHSPVITGLQATPEMVSPGGTCQVACNVTGLEGDELSYNWSASGGEITGKGAAVTWTAPRSPGSYNVTVVVTGARSGKATAYRTITVNTPPTIISLVAGASWATPLSSVRLICAASDPDGDALTYEWTADGGDVSGTGAAVNWTAPQAAGAYNITVAVSDGHGAEATGKLSLSVNLGIPPTIEDLIVTAPESRKNPYLRRDGVAGCDYEVYQTKQYNIECTTSDTSSELVYQWSCDGGEISGEGSNITWTAPSTPGDKSLTATVMVTVSDVVGNSVSESIVFYVSYCTCPF